MFLLMFGARFADNADDDKIFASFETEPGIFNDKLMIDAGERSDNGPLQGRQKL